MVPMSWKSAPSLIAAISSSERPYRQAMASKAALGELRANAGTQFNPVVVEAFIAVVVGERRAALHGAMDQTQQVFQQALEAVKVRAS